MFIINSKEPLYLQIYENLKTQIRQGELPQRSKLPSKRNLANILNVSVNTIDAAYAQLVSEGYVEAVERKGFFVGTWEAQQNIIPAHQPPTVCAEAPATHPYLVDFSPTDIDLYHFPFALWRKLLKKTFDEDDITLLKRPPLQGHPALREALRHYLYHSRGVHCRTEQIVIGAGTDALLNILAELFQSNTIALENPLHSNAYRIFQQAGCQILPIPLDQKGLNIEYLPAQGASAVYVTPSHQFPMGISMPIGRRIELLKWAENTHSYIIEDDYDSEFRYNSRPLPSLQGLDTQGSVIYLGTFSKSVAPSLRVGYMVLPEKLLPLYQKHNKFKGSMVSAFEQRLLSEFMNGGHFEKHINRMRKIYRNKREIILQELGKCTDTIKILGEDAGQHVLIEVLKHHSLQETLLAAEQAKIKIYPLQNYYIGNLPPEYAQHFLLGYGGLSIDEIRFGVQRLMKFWH